MNRLAGLVVAGLVLLVGVTPSWGGPPNPTASDANDNAAGGTNALQNVTTIGTLIGRGNAALGAEALQFTTTGTENTGVGVGALQHNTTGFNNTASGTPPGGRQRIEDDARGQRAEEDVHSRCDHGGGHQHQRRHQRQRPARHSALLGPLQAGHRLTTLASGCASGHPGAP